MKSSTLISFARVIGALVFGSFLISHLNAQGAAAAAPTATPPTPPKPPAGDTGPAKSALDTQLNGLKFSGGIAAIFMKGDRQVANAAVEGGVLRADFKSRERLGPVFEAHYLWGELLGGSARQQEKLKRIKKAIEENRPETIADAAFGLMVGAELGENAIRSLGFGPIVSFRRIGVDESGKLTPPKVAFNLGAMVLIEQNVKMLADGFHDGRALPAGQTSVRFKEDSRTGFAITFSAGF